MKTRVCEKYKKLPGKAISDKLLCAGLILLQRFLAKRNLVDINGEPAIRRCAHWPHCEYASQPCKVICMTGFGHSGSGAVSDLLSEYDGVESFAYSDPNGSLQQNSGTEFDLLASANGLFALEKAFQERSDAARDAAVKTFLRLVYYLYFNVGRIFNDDFLRDTREFLDKLILGMSEKIGPGGYAYCGHLAALGTKGADILWGPNGTSRVIWLKELSVDEFRSVARDYVAKLIGRATKGRYLVLDQAVNDGSAEIKKYQDYLGPIKNIAVYRDPRDVYATAQILEERWIPSDPDVFICWYKYRLLPYLSVKHDDFMLCRFEDVVLEYQTMVRKIEDFVGLDSKWHTRPKTCFDPSVSCKNIGIYKTVEKSAEKKAIEKIAQALKEYCFA